MQMHESGARRKLIVISFDAMVWEDHSILERLPMFRSFFREGALVKRVRSIYPTLTYPCHATMLTGCWPDKHGVFNNTVQIPGVSKLPWQFYHDAVRCADLMDACKAASLKTASVGWPLTGNHPSIDYLLDEIWPEEQTVDAYRQAILSSGTSEEIFNDIISPCLYMRPHRRQPESSYFSTRVACGIIRRYRPDILTLHVGNVDHYRHVTGVFSERVELGLAECERILTDLVWAAKDAGVYEETSFVATSDHGQLDITRTVYPNILLRREGLIETDADGKVTDWKAYCYTAGMSTHVVLRRPEDRALWDRVYSLLKNWRDESVWGIGQVYTAQEVLQSERLKGNFSFVLETDGYSSFGNRCTGVYAEPAAPSLTGPRSGRHGYHPDKGPRPMMLCFGPAFRKGAVLENACLADGAPTWARILGVSLPDADGRVLEEILA